jgi:hypothetical protein
VAADPSPDEVTGRRDLGCTTLGLGRLLVIIQASAVLPIEPFLIGHNLGGASY